MPPYDPNGPRRWPSQHALMHKCIECGTAFMAVRIEAGLCSAKCRQRASRRRRKEKSQHGRVTT